MLMFALVEFLADLLKAIAAPGDALTDRSCFVMSRWG